MSTRQDSLEDRLTTLEDKLGALQEQLDLLPDLIASRIQAQVGRHFQNTLFFRYFCRDLEIYHPFILIS